ncbi:MAG: T9SS type A sorting domain-containing protein [Candidatus Marinimicrobia bacterium]|nr:T9SS type A sorting domain-containing protein [Candidatus Neomarinimicrobiota bacterium]
MIKVSSLLWVCFLFSQFGNAQSYNWPCEPFTQQHWVNGTFCECRSGTSGDRDHFHDGIDIHLPQGEPVYSVINGTVSGFATAAQSGINSWIRAGRYAYVHVDPNPALSVGSQVIAFQTILGWTNSWNHIHFKDGYPGSETNSIRADGGLDPLVDTWKPTILDAKFYINGTNTQFQNNRVFGDVDIVSRAWDRTDSGPIGDNNGIYKIGFDILDSTGSIIFGPRTPFEFYNIPASDNYITNVFAPGSNTGTYRYTITNNVSSDNKIDVSDWNLGSYTARVFTWDQYFQTDTLLQVFEVTESDDTPPNSPTLLSVLREGNGFRLNWLSNQDSDLLGYRLYFSYDNSSWYSNHDETILTAEISEYVVPSFSSEMVFLYITAVDDGPFTNESEKSNTVVFRKSEPETTLLLVDASRNNNIIEDEESVANLGSIIDTYSSLGIETVHDSLISLYNDTLSTHQIAWIHFGIRRDSISNGLVEWLMTRHINSETKTLSMGAFAPNMLFQSNTGQNYLDSLGIDSVSYEPLDAPITVSTHDFLGELNDVNISVLIDSIGYGLDFSNSITIPLISFGDHYLGFMNPNDNNSIVLSTPLEMFSDPDAPALLILDHFFPGSVSVKSEKGLIPSQFMFTTYPNPFNETFAVQINGQSDQYLISMFDILGKSVLTTSYYKKSSTGSTNLSLSPSISSSATGVYFVQIKGLHSPTIQTQKVLYLK